MKILTASAIALILISYQSNASELGWSFKSPAFHHGNGYSTHVLSVEQIQYNRKQDQQKEAEAEARRIERELEGTILAKLEKLEQASKHPDLGPVGDGLISLMDQKLSKLDDRLYDLSSKISNSKIQTSEIKHEKEQMKQQISKSIKETFNFEKPKETKIDPIAIPPTKSRQSFELTTLTNISKSEPKFPLFEKKEIVKPMPKPKIIQTEKSIDKPAGFLGLGKAEINTYEQSVAGEATGSVSETSGLTEKQIACIKAEGSGEATGKLAAASITAPITPVLTEIPYVGWLVAGFFNMFGQKQGGEIGGQMARDFKDC